MRWRGKGPLGAGGLQRSPFEQARPESGEVFAQLFGAVAIVVTTIANVVSARVSNVWLWSLWALLALPLLWLVVRKLGPRYRSWQHDREAELRLRALWPQFVREVDERTWILASDNALSLPSLITRLRDSAADPRSRDRVSVLRGATAYCSVLDGIRRDARAMVAEGAHCVRCLPGMIGQIELLLDVPSRAGWIQLLGEHATSESDGPMVQEWLQRYRESVRTYGRWARDANARLGESVFGSHFY